MQSGDNILLLAHLNTHRLDFAMSKQPESVQRGCGLHYAVEPRHTKRAKLLSERGLALCHQDMKSHRSENTWLLSLLLTLKPNLFVPITLPRLQFWVLTLWADFPTPFQSTWKRDEIYLCKSNAWFSVKLFHLAEDAVSSYHVRCVLPLTQVNYRHNASDLPRSPTHLVKSMVIENGHRDVSSAIRPASKRRACTASTFTSVDEN